MYIDVGGWVTLFYAHMNKIFVTTAMKIGNSRLMTVRV